MIKCPFCREKYTIDFDYQVLSQLIESNRNHIENLRKVRNEIDNIMNDTNNEAIKKINFQIKDIINTLDKLTQDVDQDNNIIKGLYAMFNYKTTNTEDLSIEDQLNIKGKDNWKKHVAYSLINKLYKEENLTYNDMLQKAALIGKDGTYWAYSANFNIQPFEFLVIRDLFRLKEIEKKTLLLEGIEYKIVNYKSEFSMDLMQENGEIGATIGKINKGFVFGFFNSNLFYSKNEEKGKQNLELCNKTVEEFTNYLKGLGY